MRETFKKLPATRYSPGSKFRLHADTVDGV